MNLVSVQILKIDFYTYKAFGMGLQLIEITGISFCDVFTWIAILYNLLYCGSIGMIFRNMSRLVRSLEA